MSKHNSSRILLIRTENEYALLDKLRCAGRNVVDVLNEKDAINEIIQSNPSWVIVSAGSDQDAIASMIKTIRPWFSGRVMGLYENAQFAVTYRPLTQPAASNLSPYRLETVKEVLE